MNAQQTCLHDMVILRSQKKITHFLMILAWLCRFKILHQNRVYDMITRSTMFNKAFYLTAAILKSAILINYLTNRELITLTTDEVITTILKVISATTKVILTTEEVIRQNPQASSKNRGWWHKRSLFVHSVLRTILGNSISAPRKPTHI